ncbi:unnamed protein product [Ixodes persulcatus]
MGDMHALKPEALREVHKTTFLPLNYIKNTENYVLYRFQQEELHHIFNSDLIQDSTLVDVGSGPTINFVLSATKKFQDIVVSDLVESNRLEVEKWLRKSEDSVDWSFRAEHVADLEGHRDTKKGAFEIMERARRAISKVVPCDVLEPEVLPEEHGKTFDVVLSCNCLEAATADPDSFGRVLANMGSLVKPGGFLIMVGTGGITWYEVGKKPLPMMVLTKEIVEKAVTDAGFEIKRFRTGDYDGPILEDRGKRFGWALVARKP